MSGYTRISASLALTLAIWLPTAITAIRHPGVDTASAGLRFILVFTLARIALRGIDRLMRVYQEHNGTMAAKGTPPVDVDDITIIENGPTSERRKANLPDLGMPQPLSVDPIMVDLTNQPALSDSQ